MTPGTHRAQLMSDGALGLMVHYIVGPDGETGEEKTANYNRIIDSFPLDAFIEQFEFSGATWLIFTYGQCTGYYCGPNAFLDKLAPGHTSRRDLMKEIGRSVQALGKRLIAYLPCGFAVDIPGYQPGRARTGEHDEKFFELFKQFIRAYALELAEHHDGWWFDGILDFLNRKKTDWRNFCDNCRAGNTNAVVALNDDNFCSGIIPPVSPEQDYLAGEAEVLEDGKIQLGHLKHDVYQNEEGKWRMRGEDPLPLYMPDSQFIDGVQWHALVPVDSNFNSRVTAHRYSDEELIEFVSGCRAVGGAVTFTTGSIK